MTTDDALLIAVNNGCGSDVLVDFNTISMYSSTKNSTFGTSTLSLLPPRGHHAQLSEAKHQQFALKVRRHRRVDYCERETLDAAFTHIKQRKLARLQETGTRSDTMEGDDHLQ